MQRDAERWDTVPRSERGGSYQRRHPQTLDEWQKDPRWLREFNGTHVNAAQNHQRLRSIAEDRLDGAGLDHPIPEIRAEAAAVGGFAWIRVVRPIGLRPLLLQKVQH